jgi:hypothetical protein
MNFSQAARVILCLSLLLCLLGDVNAAVNKHHHESKERCEPGSCQNGGECAITNRNEINCTCAPNFTGRKCEFAINPCLLNNGTGNCFNSSSCSPISPAQFNASNGHFTLANFTCACTSNRIGALCEYSNNPCDYVGTNSLGFRLCQNNSTCSALSHNLIISYPDSNTRQWDREDWLVVENLKLGNFSCECLTPQQFNGPLCNVNTDPCQGKPCRHNGVCTTVSLANSTSIGSYTCACSNSCRRGEKLDKNCRCEEGGNRNR